MKRIWRYSLPPLVLAAIFAAGSLIHAQPSDPAPAPEEAPDDPTSAPADAPDDPAGAPDDPAGASDAPAGAPDDPAGASDDAPAGDAPADDAPADDPAADKLSNVTVPMEKQARLSAQEMLQRSEEIIAEMKQLLERVLTVREVARKQKDVIRLNCVNDRLIQVKKLLNIAEAARNDLVEAIAAKDERERYHQFSKVTIAHENVSVLRDEAEACVGEELIFLGPTEVEVDKPPIVDDPTRTPPFDLPEDGGRVERPEFATAFM